MTSTARTGAVWLLDRGFVPVPVHPRTKRPIGDRWQTLTLDEVRQHLDQLFPPDQSDLNVGILNGAPSGGLVDIDLDTLSARRAARILLPRTNMRWGRQSAPDSHYAYLVDEPPDKAKEDFDSTDGVHHLEIRSTGGHTLFPPSMAPGMEERGTTEERVVWGDGVGTAEPTKLTMAELRVAVGRVAAASRLAGIWSNGRRHEGVLPLAGGLLRAGWSVLEVVTFVRAICATTQDPEVEDRVRAVESTAEALSKGKNVSGWPTFVKLFGEPVTRQIHEWLGIKNPASFTGGGAGQPRQARYIPIPPWQPFPVEHLPDPWKGFVSAASKAIGADPAFFALPVLSVIGGAIGNTRRVALKKDWTEPPVIWSCIVGESSSLKSPALAAITDPVRDVQERHIEEYRSELAGFDERLQCWTERKRECDRWRKAQNSNLKNPKRENADDDGLPPEDPGERPEPPTLKRVYCSDTTIERLADLLHENPRGLLVVRDELSGWLGSFTKYKGRSGATDLPNWLEMHRAGAVTVDRKTGDRKFTYVPRAAASVTGGIQPGILSRQLTPEFMASGLTARLLLAMPPTRVKVWSESEIPEDTVASVRRNLEALYALDFLTNSEDKPRPYLNKLSPEAKNLWVDFYNTWASRQAGAEGELAAAFGKLEAYAARFALLHHVVTTAESSAGTGAISSASMEHGIALAMWFAHETERIYAMLGETEEETELRRLVETVERLAARNGGRVTAKILQQSNGRRYRSSADAEGALESLATAGLGRWEEAPPKPKGGRPSSQGFVLCPTFDDSYQTPDGQDDGDDDIPPGASDETPDGQNGPPPDGPQNPDGSPYQNGGNGESKGEVSEVWYVSSNVGHDNSSPFSSSGGGSEGVGPPKGLVGRPGVSSDTPFTRITTAEGVNLLAGGVEDWGGAVALDTETTGLDPTADRVRLIQVAFGGTVAIVDLFALPDPAAALAPLFEALATVEVVGHNLQFDLRFLARLGFVPGPVFCTMLASQVLHAGERDEGTNGRLRHSLAEVAEREFGITLAKEEQDSDWSRAVLTPDQLRYAADDVRHLVPLADKLKEDLVAVNLFETATLEMRALKGIAWAKPVAIDRGAWSDLARDAATQRDKLAEEMDILAPNRNCLPGTESRNWNSPDEVKAAFGDLGIALGGTDDDTLAGIDHPLAAKLRDYRGAAKRVGTYGTRWLDDHAPRGEVLPSWNQLGAQARMSCSSPNLQQIPRGTAYRKCFIARPGNLFVKADYSQIELRVAAVIAGESRMIQAYAKGEDLHTLTAAALTGKTVTEVAKADRQLAKAVNFGLLYGMGWKSLGRYAAANYGVTLSDGDAKKHHAAFFRTYPLIRAWHARVEQKLQETIRQNPDAILPSLTRGNRRRLIPAAKRNAEGRAYPNKTEHLNFPVQGTAADGMKAAIALLWERRDQCPGAVPVLFVHDEIVIEVPESAADTAKNWLVAAMVDGMQPLLPGVPVAVEATIAKSWGG